MGYQQIHWGRVHWWYDFLFKTKFPSLQDSSTCC
jgi:hypothetical protein